MVDDPVIGEILAYISAEYGNGETITPDQPLLKEYLDSLAIFNLASYIEGEFGVRIHDDDLTVEHFKDARAIASLIEARRVSAD